MPERNLGGAADDLVPGGRDHYPEGVPPIGLASLCTELADKLWSRMRDVAWLFIISDPCPYRWVAKHNQMAFRRTIRAGGQDVLPGDPYALYLAKRATRTAPRIVGIGTIASALYPVDIEICGDQYKFACDLLPSLVVKPEQGADFRPLVSQLETVSGQRWQVGFIRSLRLLTKADHHVLTTALREAASDVSSVGMARPKKPRDNGAQPTTR